MTYSLLQENIRKNARILSSTKHEGKKVYALHKPFSCVGEVTAIKKIADSYVSKDGFEIIGVFENGKEVTE